MTQELGHHVSVSLENRQGTLFLSRKHLCVFVALTLDLIQNVLSFFLSSFDQLACLGELRSLSELTLDGNPVALETWYKQAVLRCVLHLRQLDMKRITVRLLKCVCVCLQEEKAGAWTNSANCSCGCKI